MTELPKPGVFEHWEEKVKAWKDVQSVLEWIQSDADLYDAIMKMARKEITIDEALDLYETALTKRGESDAAARLRRVRSERLSP